MPLSEPSRIFVVPDRDIPNQFNLLPEAPYQLTESLWIGDYEFPFDVNDYPDDMANLALLWRSPIQTGYNDNDTVNNLDDESGNSNDLNFPSSQYVFWTGSPVDPTWKTEYFPTGQPACVMTDASSGIRLPNKGVGPQLAGNYDWYIAVVFVSTDPNGIGLLFGRGFPCVGASGGEWATWLRDISGVKALSTYMNGSGDNSVSSTDQYNDGIPHLVEIFYDFGGGVNDTFSLYIDGNFIGNPVSTNLDMDFDGAENFGFGSSSNNGVGACENAAATDTGFGLVHFVTTAWPTDDERTNIQRYCNFIFGVNV